MWPSNPVSTAAWVVTGSRAVPRSPASTVRGVTNPQQQTQFALNLPPELEAGVYASFANIWHDPDGFVFDFGVAVNPPQLATDEATGNQVVFVQSKIVSRVRIPASQAWEFMRALNSQLDAWEREHRAPEPPSTAT